MALRFSRLGAATAVVLVSSIAIAATVRGGGPYLASLSVTGSLVAIQALNGCVALVALVLAAVTDQGRAARSALEHLTMVADLEDVSAALAGRAAPSVLRPRSTQLRHRT